MAINLIGFALGSVLAEREGVTDSATRTRLGLIGGLLGSSATGLVVTSVLARREAESVADTGSPGSISTTLVEVPDVTNQPFEAAQQRLQAPPLGLKVQRQSIISIDKPAETVVSQIPTPGKAVPTGSTVTLMVNQKVIQPVKGLPNVINQPFDTAKQFLEPLGATITSIEVDSKATKGVVIMQNPDPGSTVAKGDPITLLVSTGISPTPELVNLPDYIGKPAKDAQEDLKSRGFCVQVQNDGKSGEEIVKDQNPKGGTGVNLPKGTAVTLTVGSTSTPVPRVHADGTITPVDGGGVVPG